MKQDWIWMPHAGHFCAASSCNFRMNTYVNGVIVSTVGEYRPMFDFEELERRYKGEKIEKKQETKDTYYKDIGFDRKYETMVFKAKKGQYDCCPFEADISQELDFKPYNEPELAYVGHLEMCNKWDATSLK